jgi:hypothetical protein
MWWQTCCHAFPRQSHLWPPAREARLSQVQWQEWQPMRIKHSTTTAFHPCSNGMVERAHCQLKDMLRARQVANDWLEHLPCVLLGLRASPKEDSGISPAEMVLGKALVLPGHLAVTEQPLRPPGRSYRDVLVASTPRHIPTSPLPPPAANVDLSSPLQQCQGVYL